MMHEPTITINGRTLTPAEAMTMRVAATSLQSDLTINGLGDDEHGQNMRRSYLFCLDSILGYMHIFNQIT